MKNTLQSNYRRHVWMVQIRDSQMAIDEKIADGVPELVESEWRDALKAPVWGKRADWHAVDMESAGTETRVVMVRD